MGIIKNVDSEKIKVASKKENKRKSLNEDLLVKCIETLYIYNFKKF